MNFPKACCLSSKGPNGRSDSSKARPSLTVDPFYMALRALTRPRGAVRRSRVADDSGSCHAAPRTYHPSARRSCSDGLFFPVQSKYSCGTSIKLQQASEALAAVDIPALLFIQ